MDDKLSPHIEFASAVMDLSINGYEVGDTLNGLSLAAAACLLDVTMEEDKTIDDKKLAENIKTFFDNVSASVKLAKAHLDAEVAADNSV